MANARSVFLAVIKGDASQAVTEFNKLGQTVEKSTGKSTSAIGKFKTLGSAALSELGVNATTMAATAGAAFARFAYQAANEFADLARAADNLSKATGLTIEQSSQWIEVAGDLGVESESLQGAIGRLNKNLDTGKFEKYGIATRDAAGQLLSSQEIFLNVLDAMNRTPDAGTRAKMGTELMGKGWQSLAPILGKSRIEYQRLLDSVTEGQTVTDEEVRKSEEWRASLQDLSDAMTDLKYEIADSTQNGSSMISVVADLIGRVTDLRRNIDSIDLGPFDNILGYYLDPLGTLIDAGREVGDFFSWVFGTEIPEATTSTSDAFAVLASSYIVGGINVLGDEVYTLGRNAGVASDNVLDLKSYFVELLRAIDEEKGLLDIQDSFDEVRQKAVDAFTAAVEGAEDADEKARDYRISVLNLRDEIITYGDALGDVPPEVISEIDALIDEGKLDEAEARLNALARFREATIGVRTLIGGRMDDGGVTDFLFGGYPGRANGGPVSGGTPYMVGERGPELFVPGSSGSIVPNHALGGGGVTLNVTVTNPVASGEQLANELAAYTRRNGSRWLVPT